VRRVYLVALIAVPLLAILATEGYTSELNEAALNVYHQIHAVMVGAAAYSLGIVVTLPIAAVYVAKVVEDAVSKSVEEKEDG